MRSPGDKDCVSPFSPRFRNGERICRARGSDIDEHGIDSARNSHGHISFDEHCLLAPNGAVTVPNKRIAQGMPTRSWASQETSATSWSSTTCGPG